jgi:hypothetical protein
MNNLFIIGFLCGTLLWSLMLCSFVWMQDYREWRRNNTKKRKCNHCHHNSEQTDSMARWKKITEEINERLTRQENNK